MLSCEEYDYVEIACLFQYPVRLDLKNGQIAVGKAVDTKRNSENEECIELSGDSGLQLVVLHHASKMTVLVNNPHFQTVSFMNEGLVAD